MKIAFKHASKKKIWIIKIAKINYKKIIINKKIMRINKKNRIKQNKMKFYKIIKLAQKKINYQLKT